MVARHTSTDIDEGLAVTGIQLERITLPLDLAFRDATQPRGSGGQKNKTWPIKGPDQIKDHTFV